MRKRGAEFLGSFALVFAGTGAIVVNETSGGVIGREGVALEAMFAGQICGASMNSARSLAPAVAGGHLEHLWIYLAAPVLGALLAVTGCRCVRGSEYRGAVTSTG